MRLPLLIEIEEGHTTASTEGTNCAMSLTSLCTSSQVHMFTTSLCERRLMSRDLRMAC